MIHARRFLEYLANIVEEKEFEVSKISSVLFLFLLIQSNSFLEKSLSFELFRQELNKCREKIQELEIERGNILEEIQAETDNSNTSSIIRLRANFQRCQEELQNESLVEETILNSLHNAE